MYFPSEDWQPGSLFDRVISVFDPDTILLPAGSEQVAETLVDRYAPFEVETHWPGQRGRWSIKRSIGLESALRLTLTQSQAEAWNFASGLRVRFIEFEGPPSELRLIAAAMRGYVPEELRAKLFTLVHQSSTTIDLRVDRGPAITVAFENDATAPAAYNGWGLQRIASAARWVETHAAVVVGDTTADIALWLSLRALKGLDTVFWIPSALSADSTFRYILLDHVRAVSLSSEASSPAISHLSLA